MNIIIITGASSGMGMEFALQLDNVFETSIDEIWLIAMDNQIIDIIGGRMAEPFKVSSDTTEILEIQFDGGN